MYRMADYRVLVSCPLIQDAIYEYREIFSRHGIEIDVPEIDQQLSEDELLDVIDRYQGVIAGDDEFTGDVLRAATDLKVISKWGIGTDSIDEEAAEELGIAVYNTPGAFANEVADVVLGYSIMLTRELHLIDQAVREGSWACPRGVSLAGKTMGVIGIGSIGSEVVRRAHAVGMDVLGNDVVPIDEDLKQETGIEAASLHELLKRSDVVSLNCPLTEATESMIGTKQLEQIGQSGYLINTSRGDLVDQSDLIQALETRTIAGAALDVFEQEPLPSDSPLTEFDNVILGSHNAQNTENAVREVNDKAVDNLLRGLGERG
jgi:D-3-phosphoglycerate dehydrogenase